MSERIKESAATLQANRLLTALYEQRRFQLAPRRIDESDAEFIERIDRGKTPQVVKQLEAQYNRGRA